MNDLKKAQSEGLIQIKEADKGGGVCIMNSSDYVQEMQGQLQAVFKDQDGSETSFYVPAKQKDLDTQKKLIIDVIQSGVDLDLISKNDQKIMDPSGKPGRLYGLPKIHKGIKEGKRIPACRPIVSNSGANTEYISALVDHYSKSQVRKLPSYVEDSPDILRICEAENEKGPQPLHSFPVTVDVTSLYTNIPANGESGGIQAFEKALNGRTKKEKSTMPTNFLITLLEMVLDGNIFQFGEQLWQQKIGTAMGTKVAPTYACLFMGWLEGELLKTWSGEKPYLWRRYIDDIFFLWHGTVDELELFINHLNSQHSHIKFTATYDENLKSIPFLDMQVTINREGFIQTDLFKKDTAKCQYLLPSSCHPAHITRNIPYSLAYRLLRICSSEQDFNKRIEELRQDLLSRNLSLIHI